MAASLSNGKAVFEPPYKRTSSSVPRQQENTKKTEMRKMKRGRQVGGNKTIPLKYIANHGIVGAQEAWTKYHDLTAEHCVFPSLHQWIQCWPMLSV
jgi:hypothetical protein